MITLNDYLYSGDRLKNFEKIHRRPAAVRSADRE